MKRLIMLIGMLATTAHMIYILIAFNGYVPGPKIAWPWYALFGSVTTLAVAFISCLVISDRNNEVVN